MNTPVINKHRNGFVFETLLEFCLVHPSIANSLLSHHKADIKVSLLGRTQWSSCSDYLKMATDTCE